jgi:hypothetical protein
VVFNFFCGEKRKKLKKKKSKKKKKKKKKKKTFSRNSEQIPVRDVEAQKQSVVAWNLEANLIHHLDRTVGWGGVLTVQG